MADFLTIHGYSNGKYHGICDDYQSSVIIPICSMYGIFTNICLKHRPNVGTYTIDGAYGICYHDIMIYL